MSRNSLFIGLLMVMTVIVLPYGSAYPAWIDQWYSTAVRSAPDSFRGEQRGYASLGQASYRWNPNPEVNWVTFQRPRMKAGCGGLDLFLGGMSFANLSDMLVAKYQALVASAPSIAFQVALGVLNEGLKGAMNDIEAATNILNGLQVDDCGIQQGIVDSVSAGIQNKDAMAGVAVAADSIMNSQIVSGSMESFHQAKQFLNGKTTSQANIDAYGSDNAAGAVSSCPSSAQLQAFLTSPSVLYYLLHRRGYDNETIELARGIVGDIAKPSVFESRSIPPCDGNKARDGLEILMSSGGYGRRLVASAADDGDCYALPGNFTFNGEVFANLNTWATSLITRVGNAIINRQPLDATTEQYLQTSPVYLYIKSAVAMDQLDSIRTSLVDMTTRYFVFKLVSDLAGAIDSGIEDARSIANRSSSSDPNCQTINAYASLMGPLTSLRDKLSPIEEKAADQYFRSNEQLVSRFNQMAILQNQFNTLFQEFSSKFGTSLTTRLTKG